MNKVKQLFNQAESFRTEESKSMGLKDLCDKMAYQAGWHTEYTPSNRSKVKDKVKYLRAFDNTLFCELLCRYKKPILVQFQRTNSLNLDKTSEKIYDVILRFMYTYNPTKIVCNAQVTSRMSLSIRQRAIECNFESNTKYTMDSTNVYIKDADGNIIGRKYKDRSGLVLYETLSENYTKEQIIELADKKKSPTPDWRCHKEVSLDAPVISGSLDEKRVLGDVIADPNKNPEEAAADADEIRTLEKEYTNSETQKIFLRILMEFGSKASPKKLLDEYLAETGADPEKAKKEVFKFYKNLKQALSLKYSMN